MIQDEPQYVEEYKEVNQNMRHNDNSRFAILTVFVAFTAGFITVLFNEAFKLNPFGKVIVPIAGLVVTLAFWVNEERVRNFFEIFQRRARELELLLGYSQHTLTESSMLITMPVFGDFHFRGKFLWEYPRWVRFSKNWLRTRVGVRIIYFGGVLFWFVLIWVGVVGIFVNKKVDTDCPPTVLRTHSRIPESESVKVT